MKNKHQAIITKILEQLEKIKTEVEKVKNELQKEYDELSFEAQTSEYGDELQTALDSLDAALWDGLETAEDELNNVASSLELLPTCDRGEEEDDYEEDEDDDNLYLRKKREQYDLDRVYGENIFFFVEHDNEICVKELPKGKKYKLADAPFDVTCIFFHEEKLLLFGTHLEFAIGDVTVSE